MLSVPDVFNRMDFDQVREDIHKAQSKFQRDTKIAPTKLYLDRERFELMRRMPPSMGFTWRDNKHWLWGMRIYIVENFYHINVGI